MNIMFRIRKNNAGGGGIPMKGMLSAVACCAALPLVAVDAYWTNTTAQVTVWTDLTQWTDAEGNALEAPPTNITDNAVFPSLANARSRQAITMRQNIADERVNGKEGPYIPMSVGTVTGGSLRHRIIPNANTNVRYPGYTLTLLDPTGFVGIWDPQSAAMVMKLDATAEKKPTLQNLTTTCRPEVNVPTAGTTARVANLTEFGSLVKNGSGKLEIGTTTGIGMDVYVKGGSVSFDGTHVSDAELDSLMSSAFIHLDASAAGSYQTTTLPGHGDLNFVTNWADVRGEGYPHAWAIDGVAIDIDTKQPIESAVLNPPFVSAHTQNGMPLIDFGSRTVADIAAFGPTNCVLEFTRSGVKIREVFMAMQRLDTAEYGAFLGAAYGDTIYFIPSMLSYRQFIGASSHFHIKCGDITVNGFRLADYDSNVPRGDFRDFHTFSLSTIGNIDSYYIASDRLVWGRTGGMRLGEMIVFTNALTRAQRIAIERRLNEKWVDGVTVSDADVGMLGLAKGSETVEVKGGSIVMRELRTSSGKIVKTGAGELVVGSVTPSTSTVEVVEGSVSFAAKNAASSAAPASGAYIWLDASDPTTYSGYIHTEEGNPTNYITAMKDVRNNGTNATTWASAAVPHLPYIVANAVGGRNAIGLGHSKRGDQSALVFPNFSSTAANAYAGFLVIRMTGDDEKQDLFGEGGGMLTFRRTVKYRLLSNVDYIQDYTPSATWTVNGVAIDPLETDVEEMKLPQGTNEFFLVAFSSRLPVCCTALTKRRTFESFPTAMGGYELAECIVYNRPISDAERRDTEAYLMSKWLGKTHPFASAGGVGEMKFAAGRPIAVANDGDVSVTALSGGNGAVVKSGAGSLSVAETLSSNDGISSISVDGGTLRIGEVIANDSLLLHFDATDLGTITYHTVAEGDGSLTTNVTVWADVGGNGLCATSVIQDISVQSNISFTNPTYHAVQTAPGVTRPMVDFGRCSGAAVSQHYPSTAGMDFNRRFTNVREVHVVWAADAEDKQWSAGDILCDRTGYHYTRNTTTILSDNYGKNAPEIVWGGQIEVDGSIVDKYFAVTPEQPYLCSFVPTNNTFIGAFARDRITIDGGGSKLGEVYAFSSALTARQHAYIIAKLKHKWFSDDPVPFWTNSYASVALSAGGALVVEDGAAIRADVLSGDGSITAAGMVAEGFASAMTGDNAWQRIDVNGTFAFDGAATVSLTGIPGARLDAGEYTVLSATGGITGFNAANVSVSGLPRNRFASVRQVGDTLVVKVSKPGLYLIVE